MHRYQITITAKGKTRVYLGWYLTPANAIFGALRADEKERPNRPGYRIAPKEDTDIQVDLQWEDWEPERKTTKLERVS